MSVIYRLYKLANWLRDVKHINMSDYLILCSIGDLNSSKGWCTKWDVSQLNILKLNNSSKSVNKLCGKGYVAIGNRRNPFISARLELTTSGKMLLTHSKRLLGE